MGGGVVVYVVEAGAEGGVVVGLSYLAEYCSSYLRSVYAVRNNQSSKSSVGIALKISLPMESQGVAGS